MPYNKFKKGNKYCIRNRKTGRTTCYKSEDDRNQGIRIREAFAHGWKPTRKKYATVRSHRRKGKKVRQHRRRIR